MRPLTILLVAVGVWFIFFRKTDTPASDAAKAVKGAIAGGGSVKGPRSGANNANIETMGKGRT